LPSDLYEHPAAKPAAGIINLFGGDADSPACRKAPTGTNHPATASASFAFFCARSRAAVPLLCGTPPFLFRDNPLIGEGAA